MSGGDALLEAARKQVRKIPMPAATVGCGTKPVERIARMRERHHMLARLVTAGIPHEDICRMTGTTLNHLDALINHTPAFVELLALYGPRAQERREAFESFYDIIQANMLQAELIVRDKIIEEGDDASLSVLNKIIMDRADRTGYGKQNLNLNVNVDLKGRMETLRRKKSREVPSAGVGERGEASSADSAPRSAPLLELKAEPAAAEPAVAHPTVPAAPAQAQPQNWLAKAYADKNRNNRKNYTPPDFEPIARRI